MIIDNTGNRDFIAEDFIAVFIGDNNLNLLYSFFNINIDDWVRNTGGRLRLFIVSNLSL